MKEFKYTQHFCNDIDWKTKLVREKLLPVPLSPLQIQLGLAWDQTRSSTLTDQHVTAQAIGQPYVIHNQNITEQSTRREENRLNTGDRIQWRFYPSSPRASFSLSYFNFFSSWTIAFINSVVVILDAFFLEVSFFHIICHSPDPWYCWADCFW